jgi:hypothetical protein
VNSQFGVGVGLPRMFPFAMTLFAGGLVLILAGLLALMLGRPRRTNELHG